MAEVVAIVVKIGLGPKGATYPNFNSLPVVSETGLDWSHWIDRNGSGWLYDCCGHGDESEDSPVGTRLGMLLVSERFAEEAVAAFPSLVSLLDESAADDFYAKKHMARAARLTRDATILTGLEAEIRLQKMLLDAAETDEERETYSRRLKAALADAADVTDASKPSRGVTQTPRKSFEDFKKSRNFKLKSKE